ncbi:unnamed protein product [Anisakis simplex]|uniref:Peptidase A1 domain-containing protein n=1 Tax=Anisakis simplex TaxID=6269 RepID=A0A0M3JBC5_ANISI|nr:unnamed protein product [Anisakis simplex]
MKRHHMQNKQSDTCEQKQRFDSATSSTYKAQRTKWQIRYGEGGSLGIFGEDVVRFGGKGSHQLVVPNTVFGQALAVSETFKAFEMDGILGLGFQSIAVGNVLPPLNNAWNQDLLDQPIFTVWLQRRVSTAS